MGFICIIGCGGGGDGVTAQSDVIDNSPQPDVIDNSPFFGDYTRSVNIDSCAIENQTITIGEDSTKKDEDDYIYVPQNQSSITYTKVDRTITIDINGLTIIYTEDGQDFSLELSLVFSDDYNNFTINGDLIEDDPAACGGIATGTGIRVGTVGVTIDFNYLQYRTSNTFNGNRGYVELTEDGIPVEPSDIQKIEVKDSSGILVTLDTVNPFPTTYFNGMWNSQTGNVDFSGPTSYTGLIITFPQGFDLPADNYTLEVTTTDNKLVSKQINYPGQKVLPFVDSSTMQSVWQPDGSLDLSWTNPPNQAPGDYDQLRVLISDDNAGEMLYVRLPVNMNTITIPSDWVKIMADFYPLTAVRWQVETRSYTEEDMNYARGISDLVIISSDPELPIIFPDPEDPSGRGSWDY